MILLALAILALTALPAEALSTHLFSRSFASPGPEAGQLEGPSGVAVNSATHDVYVADTGNRRVDEFASDGTFVRAWGWEVNGVPGFGACTLTCQPGSSGSEPGQFTTPALIAVDNSAGASAGDVYVGDTGDNLVSKFTPEGALVESWGVKGQLSGQSATSPPGEVEGPFGPLAGITVDSAGTLDVLEAEPHGLFEFSQDGTFLTSLLTPRGSLPAGLAVDPAGDFFKANGNASVEEVSGSGADVGQLTPAEGEAQATVTTAVVADGSGLYLVEAGAVKHYTFNGSGEVIQSVGGPCPVRPNPEVLEGFGCRPSESFGGSAPGEGALAGGHGIAVDTSTGSAASANVYVTDATTGRVDVFLRVPLDVLTGAASEIDPKGSATLNGTVNPEGVEVTGCRFDYGTSTSYALSVPCEQTVGSGTTPVAVTAKPTGLTAGTVYHYRLQASDATGTDFGQDATFTTPPKPAVAGEASSNLTTETADLTATVNPGGLAVESCAFEYGTEPGVYSHTLECNPPAPQIGSGTSPVTITQHLTGLEHDHLYHWRILATNAAGTTTGADHTFIYTTTEAGALPDNRAYEMVTPPVKNAAAIGNVIFTLIPDIAADGSRVIMGTLQCFGDARSCESKRSAVGTSYAFSRGNGAWAAHALAPPSTQFESSSIQNANADTGDVLVSAPTPPHGQDEYYARHMDGTQTDIGPAAPPELGSTGPNGNAHFATADFSRLVVQQAFAGWPFETSGTAVLEYSGGGGAPVPVGVSGGPGTAALISVCGTEVGSGNDLAASSSALSGDGRTVFFTSEACPPAVPANELYVRVDNAETVKVSGSECGEGGGASEVACRAAPQAAAEFEGASVNGTTAFFTSTQQLTDNASEDSNPTDSAFRHGLPACFETVGANGCNLYEWDSTAPAGHRLEALSTGGVSGGPRVQGVAAISNDGSHVYFVARGVLDVAANGQGAKARDGAPNLYVAAGGVVRFIATLSDKSPSGDLNPDRQLWVNGAESANVSSDGRFLVFQSQAPLTKDDSRPEGGPAQVFRYDALTSTLARVSTGAGGFNDNGNAGIGDAVIVAGRAFSAFAGGSGRRDPSMSDDGSRVFFQSPIGLTSKALNDVVVSTAEGTTAFAQNVYEWEREGAGSCPAGRSAGCVFLISSGRDVSAIAGPTCLTVSTVCLLGTDTTGSNVFFATTDQLVPGDTDTQIDYYDARVCEPENHNPCVTAAPAPLPPCLGEACHGVPPATPGAPNAPSATFNGAGNVTPATAGAPPKCASASGAPSRSCTRRQNLTKALTACKHRFPHSKKKRASCQKAAHRKYGAKKATAHKSTHADNRKR